MTLMLLVWGPRPEPLGMRPAGLDQVEGLQCSHPLHHTFLDPECVMPPTGRVGEQGVDR